jgi:hypothetical protein
MTTPAAAPGATEPTIHAAELASGPSGAVEYDEKTMTQQEAVQRRKSGFDIVVRGPAGKANNALARSIEQSVGSVRWDQPHASRGRDAALPHYQQASGVPDGHAFYETENRKARKAR